MLLLHAHKCSQRQGPRCEVPHCSTMRNVLAHMTQCNEGRNCREAHCASSRQIIAHWKNCNKPDCPVCNPLRTNSASSRGPANPVPAAANGPSATMPLANSPAPDPNGQARSTVPAANVAILQQQQPQAPATHKPWHENITNDMRRHLVQKIIQTIFPTQDHNIYKDPRLANLVNYAVKTECQMYEEAQDQEEYFHLLAERIYKIQKEFEDKQRSRNLSRAAAGGAPSGDVSGAGASQPNGLPNHQQTIYSQLHQLNHGKSASPGLSSLPLTKLDALFTLPDQAAPPNKVAPDLKKGPFNGQAQQQQSSLNNGNNLANRALDPFQVTAVNKLPHEQQIDPQQTQQFANNNNNNFGQQQSGSGGEKGPVISGGEFQASRSADTGLGVDSKIVDTFCKEEVVVATTEVGGGVSLKTEFKQEIKLEADGNFKQETVSSIAILPRSFS